MEARLHREPDIAEAGRDLKTSVAILHCADVVADHTGTLGEAYQGPYSARLIVQGRRGALRQQQVLAHPLELPVGMRTRRSPSRASIA